MHWIEPRVMHAQSTLHRIAWYCSTMRSSAGKCTSNRVCGAVMNTSDWTASALWTCCMKRARKVGFPHCVLGWTSTKWRSSEYCNIVHIFHKTGNSFSGPLLLEDDFYSHNIFRLVDYTTMECRCQYSRKLCWIHLPTKDAVPAASHILPLLQFPSLMLESPL